jgi:hypothetical protein
MAKTVTPKKRMPPKFLVTDLRGSHYANGATEAAMIDRGARLFNDDSYGRRLEGLGIYQLVKVLRPKETPIEIEEVSCCRDTE